MGNLHRVTKSSVAQAPGMIIKEPSDVRIKNTGSDKAKRTDC